MHIQCQSDNNQNTHFLPFRLYQYDGDLRKPHYWSHAIDLYVPSNENGDCETMKVLLNFFACYKQSEWSYRVIAVFIISLFIPSLKFKQFWLVKTLVIKKTYSWVLLGHITGCNLPFNQSNVIIIFKTGIIWHQSSWRYAPKSNVVNFGYILNTGTDPDFFQWGVSGIFFGGKWWRKVD